MGDSVDIIVTQTGADEAATSLENVGAAATSAADQVDKANASLTFLQTSASSVESPLQGIASAADAAGSATANMNAASEQSDTVLRAAEAAAARLNITLEEYNQRTQNFINGTDQSTNALNQHSEATHKMTEAHGAATESTHALSETTTLLRDALAALGLVFSAEKVIEITEVYQKLEIQLKSVSKNVKELEENSKALYDISQLTGSSFGANVAAFQKLTIETQALGITQKDLLTTIRNVDAVVQESGGTSTQAAAAVNQFGRALATGEVSGRQFRTLLLQFPQLGQLVAQGLNTSTSALVSTSQKAAVSSKDFVDAFNKSALAANVAGKEIELTLGGAITTLGNSILLYVGKLENANGITSKMASSIAFLANNFETFATVIGVAITLAASYYGVLVIIPGAFTLIINSIRALTLAVAANPLGFLLVALTSIILLVYEFGNSVKLTASGNITLLGAVIGIWNVFKNVLSGIWTFLVTTFGPAFTWIGGVISDVFNVAIAIVQGFINILAMIFPSLQSLSDSLSALSNPLTKFKTIMSDAMIDATEKLNKTKEAATNLGAALDDGAGGGGRHSVASAANGMSSALQYAKSNLSDVADKATITEAAMAKLELTTRNAYGDMIVASDEWARRSGENFNKVANNAKAATSAIAQTAAAASASQGGTPTPNSSRSIIGGQSTNPMLEGGVSTDGGATFHSAAEDLKFFEQYGRPISNPTSKIAWDTLLTETSDAGILARINAAAHARHIPGYAVGGAFVVGGFGATDSQLVQFMATPGERVVVQTPEQQRAPGSNSPTALQGRPISVHMNITTPDANSFRRSQNQTYMELKSKLSGIGRF